MRLTRFSDIGLRLLMYLASEPREAPPVTVAEVAGQFGIARNHLVKVAGILAKQGWITALRGRNGGIVLAADPTRLRLGGVLRVLEGDDELIDCDSIKCRLRADCLLRGALNHGKREFYRTLDGYTLADIVAGGTGEEIVRMQNDFMRIYEHKSAA